MRSIDRDFLVANIAQVGRLAEQANQYGDAVGQFQLARRKQEFDAELAALSTPRRHPLKTAWIGFLAIILALTILGLQGCASFDLEQSIGVGPEDNAILRVEAHIDPAWSESSADYCRTEFPADLDISTLSPEQLEAATEC